VTLLTDYTDAIDALEAFRATAIATPAPAGVTEECIAAADAALSAMKTDDERNFKRLVAQGI
jgi:hypothetical protein